jgi:hypothetical protein
VAFRSPAPSLLPRRAFSSPAPASAWPRRWRWRSRSCSTRGSDRPAGVGDGAAAREPGNLLQRPPLLLPHRFPSIRDGSRSVASRRPRVVWRARPAGRGVPRSGMASRGRWRGGCHGHGGGVRSCGGVGRSPPSLPPPSPTVGAGARAAQRGRRWRHPAAMVPRSNGGGVQRRAVAAGEQQRRVLGAAPRLCSCPGAGGALSLSRSAADRWRLLTRRSARRGGGTGRAAAAAAAVGRSEVVRRGGPLATVAA